MARSVGWDVKRGRALWADGWSGGRIALELGTCKTSVLEYAKRHWPTRRVRSRITPADRERVALRLLAPAPAPEVPPLDLDIACYRAHKERAELERVESERMAEAQRLMSLYDTASKPKRGRPRQDFRGEGKAA